MTKIFVSYRTSDNADFVYRIRDWLMNRYGADNVFIDFDGLPPFVVFEDIIRERIAESDAVLVIIGPHWLEMLHQKAASGDDDYVKIEIEAALAREVLIVAPVLIKGASMPVAGDLPKSIRPLCKINAARLKDGGRGFSNEISALMDAIDLAIIRKNPPTPATTEPSVADAELQTAEVYAKRARAFTLQGYFDEAISEAGEAIRLNPQLACAYVDRAWSYFFKADYDQAIKDATQGIILDPMDAAAYEVRGKSYEAKGQYALENEDYRFYLYLVEKKHRAWLKNGYVKTTLG